MQARFAREAQAEFEEVQRYYEQEEAGLGEAFAESVRQGLRFVLAQPASGRIEFEDVRRVILKRFPYKLLYTVEPDHRLVVAVAHQRRQPQYWLSRVTKK
jgi:plasmid stabilization system protein ParE